jgi:hypothetical protein
LLGQRFLFGDNTFDEFNAPLVRLVEVDRRAEERARAELVGVAPDRVLLARIRCDLVAEDTTEDVVGVGGVGRVLLQSLV